MPDAVALAMVEALPAVAPTVGWNTNATTALRLSGAAVSTDGTRIYVSHGYDNTTALSVTAGLYIPIFGNTGSAQNGPSASVARQGVAGAWCNGKHYAIGGNTGSSNNYTATVETYTPAGTNGASGVWSTAAPMTPGGASARAYSSATTIGNSIYVAGGQGSGFTAADLFRYDSGTNTWTTLASMPAARTQGAMAAVGSKLYYLGGFDSNGTATSTIYGYDTTAGTWSTFTYSNPSVMTGPAAVIGSAAYVYADGADNSISKIDFTSSARSTVAGTLPFSHGNGAGFVALGGSVYLVSGSNTANVDKLDLSAGVGFTSAVLGAKSLLNPLLAGVAATLPNTPPTATADRNAYAQTVQTLKALTYIS